MDRPKSQKLTIPETIPVHSEKVVVSFPSFFITHYIMIVLLIVAAFLLGNLTAKVKYLEAGGRGNQAASDTSGNQMPAAKYSSFDDALKKLAQEVKLDDQKLLACANSGEMKSVVDKDAAQGSTLGVRGTPAFFINGRFLGGAFPFEAFKDILDKELNGNGSNDYTAYNTMLQQAYSSENPQNRAFDPVPKNIDIGNAPVQGPANAKVTIVEFSDFQCPYCKRGNETITQVMKEYNGKVRLVFKHFPLNAIHPKAQKAAETTVCAASQGKFWELHDRLFATQDDWSAI